LEYSILRKGKPGKEKKMKKRSMGGFILLSLFSILFFAIGVNASEQYPAKPITFVVGLEAGSDGDVLARPVCQKVASLLGKPVLIVNKPGAGSTIGFRAIHDSKPDGYTIGWASATIVAAKLQGLLPYDHEDLTIIGTYATYIPIIVAATKSARPFKTIEEALSFAKSHPGDVSIATSGVGQVWWVATMAFQSTTELKFNIIPQPGAGAFTIAQVAGGHADLGILGMGGAKSQIDAGNAKLLAVFGSKRAPGYEQVPSLKEVGYDIRLESTQVIIGPPKMPQDVVDKLAKAFEVAAADPEYQKFVIERNAIPYHLSPTEAVSFLNDQRKIYRAIMEKAGILKEK